MGAEEAEEAEEAEGENILLYDRMICCTSTEKLNNRENKINS